MKELSRKASADRSNHSFSSRTALGNAPGDEDHPDLVELEQRLTDEVDDEFFEDPRKFHTLHRVIDVLGMQIDANTNTNSNDTLRQRDLDGNPAYRDLKDQQQVVEEAIEHLALIHCADLNGSVVQVGRVARQFHDAVTQVRQLRKQVKEIQETLGAGNAPVPANGGAGEKGGAQGSNQTTAAATVAMSLRELWLKKLEAEAVLSLLGKLDRIRAAPREFDSLLKQHRIGAAVVTVAQALDTMFSSDVAQVQALHKIMEQLMIRKQKAEEVVWELLLDVLFLRTGNGPADTLARLLAGQDGAHGSANDKLAKNVSMPTGGSLEYDLGLPYGMINPFLKKQLRFAVASDLQVENSTAVAAGSSAGVEEELKEFMAEDDELIQESMMIPLSVMDAEFDLEGEERRHLEEQWQAKESRVENPHSNSHSNPHQPSYGDHVLALRTLVECLVRLRRLDDVERIIMDGMAKEVSALVQREQARTFVRVEGTSNSGGRGRYALLMSKAGATTDLRDFRKHLNSVVSSFGNVQLRLCHLSQIIRHRLVSCCDS